MPDPVAYPRTHLVSKDDWNESDQASMKKAVQLYTQSRSGTCKKCILFDMRPLEHEEATELARLAHFVRCLTDKAEESSPFPTAIEGLSILRSDPLRQPALCTIKPALCITLQGEKSAMFGEKRYDYGPGQALVVTVEMPSRGTVRAASRTEPYLGLVLELDFSILHEIGEEIGLHLRAQTKDKAFGAFTLALNSQLLNCALRGVRLLETPDAIPALYPGIMREICYWLLSGAHGDQIRYVMMISNGHDHRVMQAVHHLRDKFREPLHVEELAHVAHMSATTFHRQFKSLTAMAPLQYQKQLRLLEARRMMVSGDANVENAAYDVGYASASQFSREYSRMFGRPPSHDASTGRVSPPTDAHFTQ